jgi:hypothetical protein
MKRLVTAAIVITIAFVGYRYYNRSYAPVKQYEQFAEEILHRRYDAAADLTDGITAKALAGQGSQERIGGGPAMFQKLFPSRFAVESSEVDSEGTVTLHGVQTVLFNPQGVESATRPAMYAKLNQIVSLRKTASGWKVTAFENKFDSMDSLSAR